MVKSENKDKNAHKHTRRIVVKTGMNAGKGVVSKAKSTNLFSISIASLS